MSNPRILIIEDSIFSGLMMEAQIHRREPNYEVRLERTMKKAIAAAVNFVPDLILTDLGLPDSTPEETLQHIKSFAKFTKVIAMTAHAGYAQKALDNGASEFIEKVVVEDPVPLLERIHRILNSCSTSSPS